MALYKTPACAWTIRKRPFRGFEFAKRVCGLDVGLEIWRRIAPVPVLPEPDLKTDRPRLGASRSSCTAVFFSFSLESAIFKVLHKGVN